MPGAFDPAMVAVLSGCAPDCFESKQIALTVKQILPGMILEQDVVGRAAEC
jgi:hypothetical protein